MPIQTPNTAIQDRTMQDIAAIITNLISAGKLQGTVNVDIGIQKVYIQLIQEELNVASFPCVLVTTQDETEEEDEENSTFEEDWVIYPVRIMICDPMSPNYQARRPDYQRWRHVIAQALRGLCNYTDGLNNSILANTPEAFDVRLRNLPVIDARLPENQFVQSGMVALVHTQETRLRNQ
jgi:hypothetical protein